MINEVNQKGESPQDSYLKTKKKGNVTVNPKKEDLMSELYTKNLKNALAEIKQQAKQSIKEAPPATTDTKTTAKKTTKKSAADPNAAKGDVEPSTPCEEVDDTQAKKDIAERMRQRLLQLTQEHDSKYLSKQSYTQLYLIFGTMINFLMPIAISIINKAIDKIPEDLDSVIKDFVIKILKKAAAKTDNKLDDELVAAVQKALLESQCL